MPADAPAGAVVHASRCEKRAKDDAALARSIRTKQLIGIAGVAAERIHKALKLPSDAKGALRVLELHPLLNPAAYVSADVDPDFVHVRRSPAYEDGSWISLVLTGRRPAAAGHRRRPSTRICVPRSPAPSRTGPCASIETDTAGKGTAARSTVMQVQRRRVVGVRGSEVVAADGGLVSSTRPTSAGLSASDVNLWIS